MALMQMKRPSNRLPPITSIYEDNYGYTINYYQPMIDYIDTKQRYRSAATCSSKKNITESTTSTNDRYTVDNHYHRKYHQYNDENNNDVNNHHLNRHHQQNHQLQLQPPHLPWTYERGLRKYHSSNLVQAYSIADLQRLSRAAAARAQQSLINAHCIIRSPFSVIKSADASRLLKHLRTDSVVERAKYRQIEREEELRRIEREQFIRLLRLKQKMDELREVQISQDLKRAIRGKSASAITAALLADSEKNIKSARREEEENLAYQQSYSRCSSRALSESRIIHATHLEFMDERLIDNLDHKVSSSLCNVKRQLSNLNQKTSEFYSESSKQCAIEIEQLNARVVEAETRLKTEVARIKKKLQIQITELEMSLDIANKTNIDLQKVIKKQSLQLTELQAHYDEVQRQLQQSLDQLGVAQRRLQSLTGELEEVRLNYDNTLRAKRAVELQYEEATTRINELVTINVNLSTSKAKIEQELAIVANDYEEITKELRLSDERYQKVQIDLKHTIETLHEEQERIIKIETIKKSLEVEVKNLSIRLEEVEANAVAGAKRIISKLESRIRDLELELEEEKRRHAETIKILRKKERTVKEVMIQCEEDQKNIILLQESLDKAASKINIYKRQLTEQEGMSQQSVTRVRRFQRELEAAEDRAEAAETNLNLIRTKHRSFVTTSSIPGSQVYLVEESRTITN